jgi:hypothetical protein
MVNVLGKIEKLLRQLVYRVGLEALAKKCSLINEQIRAALPRILFRSEIELIRNLSLFAPNSPRSYKTIAKSTLLSANQTFPFLVSFIEASKSGHFDGLIARPIPIRVFANSSEIEHAANELEALFHRYGTDKGEHDYHFLYASILRNRGSALNMLEIGIGALGAKPGASLRAFREFLPYANIYGADIDRRILFQEHRIKTFFVDQTKLESFGAISEGSECCEFDLIIDDGLHSPNGNIASLIFACKNLREGGWFVVEDISWSALPLWQVVSELLPKNYESSLISAKYWLVYALRKRCHNY